MLSTRFESYHYSPHLVIHDPDGVPHPRAEVVHLDDAPPGDAVVVRPARLVIVVALPAPPHAPTSTQPAPPRRAVVALDHHILVLARREVGREGTRAHRYRSRVGRRRHRQAPKGEDRRGYVEETVQALGEDVVGNQYET